MIVDASVILMGFFPDEEQAQAQALFRAHALGHVQLRAPTLLPYEVTNAVLQGMKRERIGKADAETILTAFKNLDIPTGAPSFNRILALASEYDRSAYDAAYLALAEETGEEMVTGDRRLYNAVRDHLSWVFRIDDYEFPTAPSE